MENRIIELDDVWMSRGRRTVLADVNFCVNRGDFVAITGPNGGGKTTMLRIMLKLLRPDRGTVTYFDASGAPAERLSIGYLPQKNAIDSHFPITVREVVEQGLLSARGMSGSEKADRVEEMLRLVELSSHAGHGIGQLSGGQMQRALLARAMVSEPQVLVLDEPLSYLDKHFEHKVYEIMEQVAGSTTVILVSHEISTIAGMANRHVIVDGGLHVCGSHHHFVHYDCE